MMAALDAIKARYRIGQYYLAGQSGGGTVTAAMLNMRTDIECAVISSGNVAVWQRVQLLHGGSSARASRYKDMTGYTDSYDPVDHISGIHRTPPPKILVLSDRNDTTVPFDSQEHYVKQLANAGFAPMHVILTAAGSAHHSLADRARPALAWCAQGLSPMEIKSRLEAGGG
jgi:protease II